MRRQETDLQPAARPAPLVPAAIGLIAGITLSESIAALPTYAPWIAAAAALLCLVLCRFARGDALRSATAVAGLGLLAASIGIARHQTFAAHPANDVANLLATDPVLTRIRGEVIDLPVSQPPFKANPFIHFDPPWRTRFRLSAAELLHNGPPQIASGDIRVIVAATALDIHPGDHVELVGRLYLPRPPLNPGETDWTVWHRLNRYSADMSVESAAHVSLIARDPHAGQRFINAWRTWARGLLIEPAAATDESESLRLLDAIVLGRRAAVDQALNDAFFRTGSIHILSVSGFHVGVLAGCAWFVLRRLLRRGIRATALITCAVVVLYALLTDLDAPIVRSTIMGVLGCVSVLLRRPFAVLNWLALSAGVILLMNPLDLFSPGFQLSFVQVLALFTIVPKIHRAIAQRRDPDLERPREARTFPGWIMLSIGRTVLGLAIVSFTAWLVAVPLVMYHFGQFAVWSAFQSMILSPFFAFVIVLGFIALLAGSIYSPAGAALAALLERVTDWLIRAVEFLARAPHTLIEVNPPPLWIVLAGYGLLIAAIQLWPSPRSNEMTEVEAASQRRRARWALVPLGAIAAQWLSWLAWPAARPADFELHVFAVGNGSCAALISPNGEAAVVDVGTSANFDAGQTAAHALRALHVHRLDTLAISHADTDHYGGVPRLLASYRADHLLATPRFLNASAASVVKFRAALPSNEHLADLHAPATLDLLGQRAEVLWPPANLPEKWSDNDTSLVLRVHIRDQTVVIPGDIERNAMRGLLARSRSGEIDLHADILIAPHHGSVAGPETAQFYAAVAPKAVIVSSATPRPKIEAVIRSTLGPACRVLTTGVSGAVTIRFHDQEPTISTWLR